jgi:protein SCO1/2
LKNYVLFFFLFCSSAALADSRHIEEYTGLEPAKPASEMPAELKDVGIEEKIGATIDLSMLVTNEAGEKVALSTFFKKNKPVVLSPIYFNCPGLCNFHLNGFVDTLKTLDWSIGNQFEMVAFSFDPKESAEVAAKKKASYLKVYGRDGAEKGWHFVTADQDTVNKLTQTVGFKFKWNEKVNDWSHASAAIVVSPEGKISRYLHGIQFDTRDVKLALNEAADGKVGNIVDSVMLYCFKYDRHQSKYGLQVFNLMKIAGALTVVVLALWLIPVMIRARRENV